MTAKHTHEQHIRQLAQAIEKGDQSTIRNLLADNFTWERTKHSPIKLNRNQYLDMVAALRKAMPDLRINVSKIQEGNPVRGHVEVTGTHKGVLEIPSIPEVPTVQPTGREIRLPAEPVHWTIEGDRITKVVIEGVEGGGLQGILTQVGISQPVS